MPVLYVVDNDPRQPMGRKCVKEDGGYGEDEWDAGNVEDERAGQMM